MKAGPRNAKGPPGRASERTICIMTICRVILPVAEALSKVNGLSSCCALLSHMGRPCRIF